MTEFMCNGEPCHPFIQRIMNTPTALRARAEIRRAFAFQDRRDGDSVAYDRNMEAARKLDDKFWGMGDEAQRIRQAYTPEVGEREIFSGVFSPLPSSRPREDGSPLPAQQDGPAVLDSRPNVDRRYADLPEERSPFVPDNPWPTRRPSHP
jgi:hypothetical protein